MSSSSVNKILVVTKEGLDDYKRILTETPLPNSPQLYFTDYADIDLALQCNIWFGSPALIAPLLKSCEASPPEWVQSTWAGVEPYVVDGMPTNYVLTNMRGIFNEFIAEYAVGHMLSHALNVRHHVVSNAQQKWNPVHPKRLAGQTAGILGVGEIGSEVARLCKAMGMTVHGYTRSSEDCKYVDQYFHGDSISDMAPLVDYWVNIMPNTPSTIGILETEIFKKMKNGAVIINAGRGKAICDEDLLEALDTGQVDAAILDVFRTEPLPPEHPYWKHPKVLITSHTAAPTEPKDAVPVFIDNYERWCSGAPVQFQVVFERGY